MHSSQMHLFYATSFFFSFWKVVIELRLMCASVWPKCEDRVEEYHSRKLDLCVWLPCIPLTAAAPATASHVWLTWPQCEAGTCTFSQDDSMRMCGVERRHIVRCGAQTHGQGGRRGLLVVWVPKPRWTELKHPSCWKSHPHQARGSSVGWRECEQYVLL